MSGVTPARQVAYAVIRRVFEEGAYADRALHGEARGLDPRERALAMQLAYGTVQRKLTLDHHIEQLARPPSELDPQTLAALRLGLYQLVFLDGVAAHAAVGESVELAKGGRSGGHKLVNAVLRRAARGELPALPPDDTPAGAAIAHSYPPWLVELWWERYGADETRALLRAGNEPGELALRVNTAARHDRRRSGPRWRDRTSPRRHRAATSCPRRSSSTAPSTPTATRCTAKARTPRSRAARCSSRARWTRSPASACSTSAPRPAARRRTSPRSWATTGEIVAVERHPRRAAGLRRTAERMGATLGQRGHRRRPSLQHRHAVRSRARRSAVQRAGHPAGPPRPALADVAGGDRARWPPRRRRSCRPPAPQFARAARSSTRPARCRRPRTRRWSPRPGCR